MVTDKKPRLRFRTFSDDWRSFKFSEVFEFKKTFAYSREQLVDMPSGLGYIHYGDIHTKYPALLDVSKIDTPKIKTSINPRVTQEDLCKSGDLVVADASEDYKDIGKSIELSNVNQDIVAGLHTFLARPKDKLTNKGFPIRIMQTDKVRKQIMKNATGISVLGISKTNLSEIVLHIPALEEQKQIADFLNTLENYIHNLRSKKIEIENYNNGMMNKIFSQEIRFKDDTGKDFPNWEKRALGKITSNLNNKRIPISKEKRTPGKYPYYGANGIVDYVNGYIFDGEYVLVAEDGVVDTSKYPIHLTQGKFWVNNHAHILKGEAVLNKFLYFLLLNTEFVKYVTGSAQTKLNSEVLSKIIVQIPHIKEQDKIGNYLTILENMVNIKQSQIDTALVWKKQLLQLMFI